MDMMSSQQATKPRVLVVDDDDILCKALARALGNRGYHVEAAHSADHALRVASENPPDYAVLDLRLPDLSGLKVISRLVAIDPRTRIVVLTGHGSIPTAIEAIKLGATYYLTKPADTDEILAAMHRDDGDDEIPLNDKPMSVRRLEWEHINRVLQDHAGNISSTARALSMHRRTLQRKLSKHPARN